MSATSGRTDGGAMRTASSGLTVDDAVAAAYADVRKDDSPTTFVLCEIVNKTTLTLLQKGEDAAGGVADAIATAVSSDDLKAKVVWGACRTASGKFYGLLCIGDDVGGMAKGRATMHKNGVMNVWDGKAGEVCGNDTDEFLEALKKTVG